MYRNFMKSVTYLLVIDESNELHHFQSIILDRCVGEVSN